LIDYDLIGIRRNGTVYLLAYIQVTDRFRKLFVMKITDINVKHIFLFSVCKIFYVVDIGCWYCYRTGSWCTFNIKTSTLHLQGGPKK